MYAAGCGCGLGSYAPAPLNNGAADAASPAEGVEIVVEEEGRAGEEMLGWLLSLVLGSALVSRARR